MGFLRPKKITPPPPPPAPAVPSQTATASQSAQARMDVSKNFKSKTILTGKAGLMDDPNVVYKKTLGSS
tara:strand:- start:18282 stop:18488 length:207 start_codon:yes stop_codon:yes gene_type:complete